jgi:hypothetical protein
MANFVAAWSGLWQKIIVNYQLCGSMVWIVAEGIVNDQLCASMVCFVAEDNS